MSVADCTKHFRARWLSTLGVVELDHAGTSKIPRPTLPDVQRGSINQQFEHDYETLLCYPRKNFLPSAVTFCRKLYDLWELKLHVLTNQASVTGGISTCFGEELVFISDSLHDRIIITDGSGGVIDYVGRAPHILSYVMLKLSWWTRLLSTYLSDSCCVIVAQ